MRTFGVTRRTVLGALALAPAIGEGGAARGQGTAAFRSVAVDIAPLLDHGGGNAARALGEVLLAQMRTVFADRLGGGGGALLTARITNLYFSIYDGGQELAFGHNDNIEGDGIVSSGGRVLSTTHILTELPPSYSGAYYTQGIDHIRLDSIAHQFAYWLRREMAV